MAQFVTVTQARYKDIRTLNDNSITNNNDIIMTMTMTIIMMMIIIYHYSY